MTGTALPERSRFASALVTGASGFIGRVLVRHLLERGVEVVVLARPGSAVPAGTQAVRVPGLACEAVVDALAGRRFDVVFHLGAYGVTPGDRDPGTTFAANIAGTAALVEAAARLGAGTLVYAGSCSEYAAPDTVEHIGETHPLEGTTLYGASKAAAGLWGTALARSFGLPFQWMRLFGVYGPGEAPHRLIPSLAARLVRGERVPLSSGEQVRDFLHVSDVAEGLRLSAEAALAGRTGPFNLCSGQGMAVRQVAIKVAEQLGKTEALLAFGALPQRDGEPRRMVGRPDRFLAATGFRPMVCLDEGLATTLSQFIGGPADAAA